MSPRKNAASTAAATYDRRGRDRATAPTTADLFDPLTVPLEPGITLVEANAGTGKTFNITLTLLRLLLDRDASGAFRVGGIGNILVVTFTNAATDELITRVRAALRDAADIFARVVTERNQSNEALFALFDHYGDDGLPRLRQALSELDQLSIFTIHGFCKRVLEESALESATAYDAGFVEDDALLRDRAVRDWWRRTTYENERIATLAVLCGWTWDAFLSDFRASRRWPGTSIDPAVDLPMALAALDAALADFRGCWDAGATSRYLAGLKWRKAAPLAEPSMRADVVRAGDALARAELGAGMLFVQRCTTRAVRHEKTGIQLRPKDAFEHVPDEPCVKACDAVRAALDGVFRALRFSCLRDVEWGFEAEKRRHNVLGFDDLLRRLRVAIEREGKDGQLARAIRRRYAAALIDEFQDTDAYQFPIFRTAFDGCPLFLIGDPKQAIYGFRGADVFAYMDAAAHATRRYTLLNNWRSTPNMVEATNQLFGRLPGAFLYDEIAFARGSAAGAPTDLLLRDEARGALHWWFVPPQAGDGNGGKPLGKGEAETRLHAALANEVVRLLRPAERGGAGLEPRNVAVLVRTSFEGRDIQAVLRRANVPSILAGMGDVLESRELQELEAVLRAVAEPNDARAVRAALATEMWGMDAAGIHRLSQPGHEQDWEALVERLWAARETWVRHGFMRMVQELVAMHGVPERLLSHEDGERRLTNLRHAIELLHTTSEEERLSPEALLLRIAQERAGKNGDAERRELRLESDADAVQIVTVHKSKGLEYDVVFCPGLWTAKRVADDEPVLVHVDRGTVVLDQGSPKRAERGRLAAAEQLAEDLRLAYVAVTRARLRCYLGWGAIINTRTRVGSWQSALGYLLRSGVEDGAPQDVAERVAVEMRDSLGDWQGAVERLVAGSDGIMSFEVLERTADVERWESGTTRCAEPHAREPLPAASALETWRVSSYTSLVAGRHGGQARDVGDGGEPMDGALPKALAREDFMAFPAGARAGDVLHQFFERLDFAAPSADVRALAAGILLRARLATDDSDARIAAVAEMAERVVRTTLPGAGFALRDVAWAETLREWQFHLPLGRVGRRTLPEIFSAHGGELARRYADALRALTPEHAQGFLTGFVDLVFRNEGRWYVVDWKSNRLGTRPASYEPAELERAMFDSHYVLQYHLYVTALHRFLRARVPGYSYGMHMGGVWYAFLRGIDGSARGWYHDRPPASLIAALDELMDARPDRAGAVA